MLYKKPLLSNLSCKKVTNTSEFEIDDQSAGTGDFLYGDSAYMVQAVFMQYLWARKTSTNRAINSTLVKIILHRTR